MLVEKLSKLSGEGVVVKVRSDVRLQGGKKNSMVDNVTKEYKMEVVLTEKGLYESTMKKEVDKDFVAKKRPWGTRVGTSCIIEHKGVDYVEFIVDKMLTDVTYFYKGEEIAKDKIVGLKDSTRSESDVGLRCMKVGNIVSVIL